MNLLKLKIGFSKRIVHFILLYFEESKVFLHFIVIDNIFQAIQNSRIILLDILMKRLTGKSFEAWRNAVSKRHVDQAKKLFSVFIDVEVEETNQHVMNR